MVVKRHEEITMGEVTWKNNEEKKKPKTSEREFLKYRIGSHAIWG